MNVPHPSKFLLLFAVILCTGCTALGAANQPPIALLVLKSSNTADEFASVLEYSKVEFESAVALRVVLPSGQTSSVTKDQIGGQFRYPDSMVALVATDAISLAAKRTEAVALATRFPSSRAALQRVVAGIDADLQRLASGQVRYRGVWQSPGASKPTTSTGPVLVIKGVSYYGADITRLDNGAVILKHDGGIVRVPLGDAPPELLSLLRSKTTLLATFRPVGELKVGGATFANAILLGQQGDLLTILHDGGVLTTTPAQVAEKNLTTLFASNPALSPATTSPVPGPSDTQSTATASVMVRTPGTGTKDPEYGWKCTPAEQKAWETTCKEPFADPSGKQFPSELQLRTGDHPPGANLDGRFPTYQETLSFINSKLTPNVLGFSKSSNCLLLRDGSEEPALLVAAFDPKELNSTVRAEAVGNHIRVVLEGRDGADCITWYQTTLGDNNSRTAYREQTSEIYLAVASEEDARRVTKALCYLIVMFGGKPSTF